VNDEEIAELKEALEFTIGILKNICPFKEDYDEIPNNLDPTFYQTGTYRGDRELHKKFTEAKKVLSRLEGNT